MVMGREDKMTEEQKALLEMVAEELGGKIEYYLCSNLHSQHKKIVIEYDHSKKEKNGKRR